MNNYKYNREMQISINELIRGNYNDILNYFNMIKKEKQIMKIGEITELPNITIENQLLNLKNNNKEYGEIFVLKKEPNDEFYIIPIYIRISSIKSERKEEEEIWKGLI